MSDVAVVGRFAGSTALGAVGSTSIFVTLFTGFLIGLGNGINVLVARFYGARHPNDVHDTVHSALIVSLIAGVILLVVGLLGSPAMLRLLNTKEDLLPGAILYLRVYFLGTKKPLYILSFAGVLNILLNLFFVIVCNLDVAGVALASAISQCVSAGLILHALTRVQDCYALHFKEAKLDPCLPGSRTPFSPSPTCSSRPVSTPLIPSWSRATAPPQTPTRSSTTAWPPSTWPVPAL